MSASQHIQTPLSNKLFHNAEFVTWQLLKSISFPLCVCLFWERRQWSVELFNAQSLPAKSFWNQNSSQENVTGSSAKKCWSYLFLFHSDTKWQNLAPVGWFNLKKQAPSPPSMSKCWFETTICVWFQSEMSIFSVWHFWFKSFCVAYLFGMEVGLICWSFFVYFIDLFICFLLLEKQEKGPWEKEGHSLLPLPKLIGLGFVGIMAEVSHMESYKGN